MIKALIKHQEHFNQEEIRIFLEYMKNIIEDKRQTVSSSDFGPIMSKLKELENPSMKFEDYKELYKKYGLDIQETKGNTWHGKTMYTAEYDGVPYAVDDHGHYEKEGDDRSLMHGIKHREIMIKRYHGLIKQVYEYCVSLNAGDIWVMCGGGAQIQAFFGNKTGYLGILYLGMENEKDEESEYVKAVAGMFTFSVNFSKNDKYFITTAKGFIGIGDGLVVEGIEVRKSM